MITRTLMSISHTTRITVIFLFAVLMLLAASIYWSLHQLESAFSHSQKFSQLKEETQQKITMPLNNYLLKGDAQLLNDISNNINELSRKIETTTSLPLREKRNLVNSINSLNKNVSVTIRAAGKLMNPTTLLIISEHEIMSELLTLNTLNTKHSDRNLQIMYGQEISIIQNKVYNLSNERQAVLSGKSTNDQTLEKAIQEVKIEVEKLALLPSMNITNEITKIRDEDDISALMGWNEATTEDRAILSIETINNINSLVKRYPKEIKNVRDLLLVKEDARKSVKQQLTFLNHQINLAQQSLLDNYHQLRREIQWIMIITIFIIIMSVLYISQLTFKLASIITLSAEKTSALAKGNLSHDLTLKSDLRECISLQESLEGLKTYFQSLIKDIRNQSNSLTRLQESSLHGSNRLTQIIEEQNASTHDTAQKIEQLDISFKEVAVNAKDTTQNTSDSKQNIEKGLEQLNQTCRSLNELTSEAQMTEESISILQSDVKLIENTLSIIRGFAAQTNLLALNAAIEAARAGESGRGFAVVADEVRQLANNTAVSAEQIQTLTNQLIERTNQTVYLIKRQKETVDKTLREAHLTQTSISSITTLISNIHEKSLSIASAAELQSAVSKEIVTAITHTASLSTKSGEEAQNSILFSQQLFEINTRLQKLINHLE